jgi:hypothetical protein
MGTMNKSMSEIRRALNGCNGEIKFDKLYVYHQWDGAAHTMSELGPKMDKSSWVTEHVVDAKHVNDVKKMLVDWELYENGWLVVGYSNSHLFSYRCQLGNSQEPNALQYLQHL